MRKELAVAGYQFASTASLDEIWRVYRETVEGTTISLAPAAVSSYQAAAGPMFTRWAAAVSPSNVHPEYPRPQMVRGDWLNLNGLWQYGNAVEGERLLTGQDFPEHILVPFPADSALSGLMRHVNRAWYRRLVDIPAGWADQRLMLHFGAVDWEANIYVNGYHLGTHRGGYDPFSFDITDVLNSTGPQEIIVGVFDPTDSGEQPRGKQVQTPNDIWYTPVTGIWQTVWLEPVPGTHIDNLRITPDVDGWRLGLTVNVDGDSTGVSVYASVIDGGQVISSGYGLPNGEMSLPVPHPKLWWSDSPHLYDLKVSLIRSGQTIDRVSGYFGMRKIEVGYDGGVPRLKLNGQTMFQVGVLDQGYWPDGLYTAPTDAALRYDIEVAKSLGYTLIRKHMKVEPARWYYWADRLGMLVWQDMPMGNNWSGWGQSVYEDELRSMMQNLHNHPSIIMWVIFNERWGEFNAAGISAMVKQIDPSRLVIGASGYADQSVGDVVSFHTYNKVEFPSVGTNQAKVLGEWGGLGQPIEGHVWPAEALRWAEPAYIESTSDPNHLLVRYQDYVNQIRTLRDSAGLSAAIYSQLTDVEREATGWLTYDREVVKVDGAQLGAINRSLYWP